jgi:hypothetical protein
MCLRGVKAGKMKDVQIEGFSRILVKNRTAKWRDMANTSSAQSAYVQASDSQKKAERSERHVFAAIAA